MPPEAIRLDRAVSIEAFRSPSTIALKSCPRTTFHSHNNRGKWGTTPLRRARGYRSEPSMGSEFKEKASADNSSSSPTMSGRATKQIDDFSAFALCAETSTRTRLRKLSADNSGMRATVLRVIRLACERHAGEKVVRGQLTLIRTHSTADMPGSNGPGYGSGNAPEAPANSCPVSAAGTARGTVFPPPSSSRS